MNQFVKFGHGTSNTLPAGVPNGYLKAVFFDKAGNVQAAESQVKYLQTSVSSWQTLELSFTASQNGYIHLQVANESDQEVFFDELEVAHPPTLIAQENHYYPYGMNMVGIEKQGMPHHRFQYNAGAKRETSFHLHWDETPFRRYDAQLGRFHGVDALASQFAGITPYQYGFNNPVMFNDPSGLSPNKSGQEMIDWAMGQLDDYNRTQYNGSVAGTADSDRWGHSFGGAFIQERDNDFALSQRGGGDPPWWKKFLRDIKEGVKDVGRGLVQAWNNPGETAIGMGKTMGKQAATGGLYNFYLGGKWFYDLGSSIVNGDVRGTTRQLAGYAAARISLKTPKLIIRPRRQKFRDGPGAKVSKKHVRKEDFQADWTKQGMVENVDPYSLFRTEVKTTRASAENIKNLVSNMQKNGFDSANPIQVIKVGKEVYVVDGHHRLFAAKQVGLKSVPVKYITESKWSEITKRPGYPYKSPASIKVQGYLLKSTPDNLPKE